MAITNIVIAQSVRYSYDNAGNRTRREIVMNKAKVQAKEATEECFSEMLSERTILIYPNPTKGNIRIKIDRFESSDQCCLGIYNMSGQPVFSGNITSSLVDIDISSRPNGIYILHILLNGQETTWRIIKE